MSGITDGEREDKKDLVHKHFLCISAAFTLALLTVHPPQGGDQERKEEVEEEEAWTISISPFFPLHIYSSKSVLSEVISPLSVCSGIPVSGLHR